MLLGLLTGLALGAGVAAVCYWRGYDRGVAQGFFDGLETAAKARRQCRPLPALPNDATDPTAPYRARPNAQWWN